MTAPLILKRAPIGPNLEDYDVLDDGIVRSGCSTKKRAKCQVTPGGIIRWQSYSTPILLDGMMTPIRPRDPIQGS
jgi:hypothetical protein